MKAVPLANGTAFILRGPLETFQSLFFFSNGGTFFVYDLMVMSTAAAFGHLKM